MDSWWFLAFLVSGCYQVGDGVGSIMEYWHQTLLEQVPRLIRIGTGSFIVYAIFLLFNPYWQALAPVCIVASALAGGYLGGRRAEYFDVETSHVKACLPPSLFIAIAPTPLELTPLTGTPRVSPSALAWSLIC